MKNMVAVPGYMGFIPTAAANGRGTREPQIQSVYGLEFKYAPPSLLCAGRRGADGDGQCAQARVHAHAADRAPLPHPLCHVRLSLCVGARR
jgi:hypothetical protein